MGAMTRGAAVKRDYRARMSWWSAEYKARTGCQGPGPHCGKLTFHHREPAEKRREVSELIGKGKSRSAILAEVEKCDVLCEACHRRVNGEPEMVTWR